MNGWETTELVLFVGSSGCVVASLAVVGWCVHRRCDVFVPASCLMVTAVCWLNVALRFGS